MNLCLDYRAFERRPAPLHHLLAILERMVRNVHYAAKVIVQFRYCMIQQFASRICNACHHRGIDVISVVAASSDMHRVEME